MVEAVKAATWQCAARAVELGQLGRSGGDGRDDERPGSTDPGLVDDGNEDNKLWEIRRLDEALEENVLSEMGHDRSGMKLKLLMTGEEDLPRVATVMNVGLRPQRIWNVLVVAVVMNGSDRGNDDPLMVGSAVGFRWWQARSTVTRGDRRWVRRMAALTAMTGGGSGVLAGGGSGSGLLHGCRLHAWLLEEGGAP
ncbi:hypothetical protein ACLOJK_036421 [Asimina triloba]